MTLKAKKYVFFATVSLGILLRFLAMCLGHNYDFESYCIVGEIAGNFRNVYAETIRYNYGFPFFCLQALFFNISGLWGANWEFVYRILIVAAFTCADLGIMLFILTKYSFRAAIIFFLNPVSILITGYHNQFDNMAILAALLSSCFYNEEEEFSKRDVGFIMLMSLSLMIKHIFFLIPVFILLKNGLPFKKKICYAVLPPLIFLISFVPFILGNVEALKGVLNNVFFYRSYNNAPLLRGLYEWIGLPVRLRFYLYILMMLLFAPCIRHRRFDEILLLYTIVMVSLSSAIADQYLAIPLAALCVMEVGAWKYIYMLFGCGYLLISGVGILNKFQITITAEWLRFCVRNGYSILTWILLFSMVHYFGRAIYAKRKRKAGL